MSQPILIVSADRDFVTQVQRYFRDGAAGWSVATVATGLAALAHLAKEPCDVVLADLNLPEMSGLLLLQEVMKRHPDPLRFLRCDIAHGREALQCVGTAHHFLLTPTSPEVLESALKRARSHAVWLPGEAAQKMVNRLKRLPSPPRLYVQVVKQLRSPDATLETIGDLISQDPAMSAKLLQLANSAAFGLQLQVTHPTQAVVYLGLETTQSLILLAHSFSYFDHIDSALFSLEGLWQHSLLTAQFARRIAQFENVDTDCAEEAFTAGLLHDLGKLILAANEPAGFKQALLQARQRHQPCAVAEHDIFQADHAEIGACLLSTWGLPDGIIEAIALHHYPSRLLSHSLSALTLTHVANALAHEATPNPLESEVAPVDEHYLEDLGLKRCLGLWRDLCHGQAGQVT